MASLTARMFNIFYQGGINFLAQKQVLLGLGLDLLPRAVVRDVVAANPNAYEHPLLEAVGDGSTAPTVAWDDLGVKMTLAATQYDIGSIQPLVGTATWVTPLQTGVGSGATARTDAGATLGSFLATGATSGRGLEFIAVIKTGSAVTNTELMIGFLGKTVATIAGADDSANSYTVPDDGAFFFYNSGVGPNWYRNVNYGSTDETTDTGIAIAADTQYLLEVKVDTALRPSFFINGTFGGRGHALDASTKLSPAICLRTLAGEAKHLYIQGLLAARDWS